MSVEQTARDDHTAQLDDLALRVLAFEAHAWQQPGVKAAGIRDEFDMSAARYYRILGELIDSPAALRHDPMLVKRLQRLRDARAATRARRSLSNGRTLD
ncbi:DUF3263 domain-containing protein [Agromyces sp. Leaf222]|uniref:DUF3263 domain-containing protein n=1 Tax=Agromyces sp. Leaf222 TaxID=1735688 RepID=UPI0006FE3BB3|nr:DUF3263 domain-containing protein [Agromyces sp. Leaf222]KQM82885.1 hypothetical protein ASE68_06135 [Agromyces sp. Leaf222]